MLLVPDNSQAASMHLISQCFTAGFPRHPRNQRCLAAKANAWRGIAEASWKPSQGCTSCPGSCEPLSGYEHKQCQCCPPLVLEEQSHSLFGYGWFLSSVHACFLLHLVHRLHLNLPASCPMYHASFLLYLSCTLSAVCSTVRLLQKAVWGRHIHTNKTDKLPEREIQF